MHRSKLLQLINIIYQWEIYGTTQVDSSAYTLKCARHTKNVAIYIPCEKCVCCVTHTFSMFECVWHTSFKCKKTYYFRLTPQISVKFRHVQEPTCTSKDLHAIATLIHVHACMYSNTWSCFIQHNQSIKVLLELEEEHISVGLVVLLYIPGQFHGNR